MNYSTSVLGARLVLLGVLLGMPRRFGLGRLLRALLRLVEASPTGSPLPLETRIARLDSCSAPLGV